MRYAIADDGDEEVICLGEKPFLIVCLNVLGEFKWELCCCSICWTGRCSRDCFAKGLIWRRRGEG